MRGEYALPFARQPIIVRMLDAFVFARSGRSKRQRQHFASANILNA
jgi:hypothetical protein